MNKKFLQIGALLALFAVIFGAFGAHSLKEKLSDYQLSVFQTGVQYQFLHAFAILVVAILHNYLNNKWIRISGWLFLAGILCFSGSLYLLSCKEVLSINGGILKILGPITPIGGLFFIIGWAMVFWGVRKGG